jgi:hypothetical protein
MRSPSLTAALSGAGRRFEPTPTRAVSPITSYPGHQPGVPLLGCSSMEERLALDQQAEGSSPSAPAEHHRISSSRHLGE